MDIDSLLSRIALGRPSEQQLRENTEHNGSGRMPRKAGTLHNVEPSSLPKNDQA